MIYPETNYIARTFEYFTYQDGVIICRDFFTDEELSRETVVQKSIEAGFLLGEIILDFISLIPTGVMVKKYKFGVSISLVDAGTIRVFFEKVSARTKTVCIIAGGTTLTDGKDYLDVGYFEYYLF